MLRLEYLAHPNHVERRCETREGTHVSRIALPGQMPTFASRAEQWLVAYLRGRAVEHVSPMRGTLTMVDAFCGCGGFALGMREGLRAAGIACEISCAVDTDSDALSIYEANLRPRCALLKNANSLVDFQIKGAGESASFQYQPVLLESALSRTTSRTDLFIAGPPCQGHSNLNNLTRRSDPRNLLYVTAAALGIALRSSTIVIENVPQVIRSHKGVVETAKGLLRSSGYSVSEMTLDASRHLCAQTRKRHFLIGTTLATDAKEGLPREVAGNVRTAPVPVSTVMADLLDAAPTDFMDEPSVLSDENIERIRYLFEHDLYELPNNARPLCHQNGHTYPSVYGRLKWDEPAQTITSGFLSPGRGRFIHPKRPRALTLREGARIQGFPDSFAFAVRGRPPASRTSVSRMIADAVPPSVGAVLGLAVAAARRSPEH